MARFIRTLKEDKMLEPGVERPRNDGGISTAARREILMKCGAK